MRGDLNFGPSETAVLEFIALGIRFAHFGPFNSSLTKHFSVPTVTAVWEGREGAGGGVNAGWIRSASVNVSRRENFYNTETSE